MASRMRAEHLKGWLESSKRVKRAAVKEEGKTKVEERGPHWKNVVDLIQTAFREGGVGRGVNVASIGDNTKGETGIPGNWASGGGV